MGLFVTFEGGEGSGKSTQVERLAARVCERGMSPLVTREPGGTALAESIRGLLLDPGLKPLPITEALLMEAARADLVAVVIRPALAEGRVVLCDRYDDSTLAYQGAGRRLEPRLLVRLNQAATGGLKPDLTLLYDIDPAIGLARRGRAAGETTRLDREPMEFHVRVRKKFLELAAHEPERFVILDGSLAPDVLEEKGWEELARRLPL